MKILVKVIPNASKTEIVEITKDYIKVKVAAPPEKNKANKELIKFFKSIGANARIVSGETSRKKLLEIDVSLDRLRELLS